MDFHRIASRVAADTFVEHYSVPMTGMLDASVDDGSYGVLKLPEQFKKAVFEAIRTDEMKYDSENGAHISVFNKDEMAKLNLPIKENGQKFTFTLESIESVNPEGWEEMEKVWFVKVKSPQLEELRKKYGFSPLLNGHNFHITVAVKPVKTKAARIAELLVMNILSL